MTKTASTHYATCGVCRRRADGVGYASGGRFPPTWVCDACGPELGRAAHHAREFDVYEQRAIEAAGGEAGSYLDAIGKSDLATLSADEWTTFLRTFLDGFTHHVREQVEQGRAPF